VRHLSGHGLDDGAVEVEGLHAPVIGSGPAGAGEAVLFVHGNPGSRLDWADLVARVGGTGVRAVALDLPGFAQADKPDSFPATVSDYAAFIEGARRQLGIERAHLVLHDFGGAFGLAWAAVHPEAFASVTIVNAPPVSGYRWYPLAHVWRTPLAGELLHATLVKPTFEALARRGHPRGLPQPFLDRMWRDYDGGTRRTVLRLYRATDARRMVPADPSTFRTLDRPAAVIFGMHDAYIPRRYAEQHRDAFPNARFIAMPESGHFPMADDPEGLARAVLPFIQEVTGHERADR
jgi:pimeloyl-ACP methyl ester carboxylesterase